MKKEPLIIYNAAPIFPIGTDVFLYADARDDGGNFSPVGPPVNDAVVNGDGNLEFDDVEIDGSTYVAAAIIDDAWRVIRATTTAPPDTALEEHIEATQNVHGIDDTSGLALKSELVESGVNVKSFGAKGDGVTDDTEAIQAAMDAVTCSDPGSEIQSGDEGDPGGRAVFFPAGKYMVSKTLVIDSGVYLVGESAASVWIALFEGANTDLLISARFQEITERHEEPGFEEDASAPYRYGLLDITLDGGETNVKGSGFITNGRRLFIQRARITGFPEKGLYSTWHSGGIEVEASIRDLVVRGCEGTSIDWGGPHDSTFADCYVMNPSGDIAIWVRDGAGGPLFSQCHVYGDRGHKVCWQLDRNAYLVNCQGEGAKDVQVHVNSSECELIAGHFFGVGFGDPEEPDESVGIKIGEDETENEEENTSRPENCQIQTRASRCDVCVQIIHTGGANFIQVTTEPAGGQAFQGDVNPSDTVSILTNEGKDFHHFSGVVMNNKGFKHHGEDPEADRPQGAESVEWLGSVEPENAIDGDTWIKEL